MLPIFTLVLTWARAHIRNKPIRQRHKLADVFGALQLAGVSSIKRQLCMLTSHEGRLPLT